MLLLRLPTVLTHDWTQIFGELPSKPTDRYYGQDTLTQEHSGLVGNSYCATPRSDILNARASASIVKYREVRKD